MYPSNLLRSHSSDFQRPIHLVGYVPSPSHSLHIRLSSSSSFSQTNSFLLPKTGGITFVNSPNTPHIPTANTSQGPSHNHPYCCGCPLPSSLSTPLFSHFAQQLRHLFGLNLPLPLATHPTIHPTIVQESLEEPGVAFLSEWEVDNLVRKRVIEYYTEAVGTLHSLDVVLSHFSNIVVPDEIKVSDWMNTLFSYFLLYYIVLSCLILSCLVFSYLVLSYLILSYLILSYLILSYLILSLSYLILSYLILSYLILSYLILSYLILSYLILSYLILSCLILSYLILSCLVLSCLVLSCLVLHWYHNLFIGVLYKKNGCFVLSFIE